MSAPMQFIPKLQDKYFKQTSHNVVKTCLIKMSGNIFFFPYVSIDRLCKLFKALKCERWHGKAKAEYWYE